MRAVVIGSLNYDLVTGVAKVPAGGETVHAHSFATHKGGKGANEAYALRRLTGDEHAVLMVGNVGQDQFGAQMLAHLKNSGVDISYVKQLEHERTGTATILVEDSGENRIMVYPGANGEVQGGDVLPLLGEIRPDFVLLQNEIPLATTFAVLKRAKELDIFSVFNPSPLPDIPIKEWPTTGLLCINEGEATGLSGIEVSSIEAAKQAAEVLLAYCELCVITLGANGVVWQFRNKAPEFEPARRVKKVVDTTGAGDTFLAALVSRMMSSPDEDLREHISFAQAASAIVVTRAGAASSMPTLNEVVTSM